MSHEISQFDIPGHQLLASNEHPKEVEWTDIGEAHVTETIFGKAKVRVIHAQDKKRNTWLLMALVLVAAALSLAAWLWLIASQRSEPQQSEVQAPSSNARVQAKEPAPQVEHILSPVTQSSVMSMPKMTSQTPINKPAIGQVGVTQQAPGLKGPGTMVAKPVVPQTKPLPVQQKPVAVQVKPGATPLVTSKPQIITPAPNNSAPKYPAAMQQPPKPTFPGKPVAPIVAAPSIVQPPVNKPATVAPLALPLTKEDAPIPAPAVDNQPPPPVNAPY